MTISGSREEHLPCEGHDHTKPGFSNGGKKPADIGWIPLAKVISMKMRRYFSAKMKVQVAAVSEDAYDLMREELEADKKIWLRSQYIRLRNSGMSGVHGCIFRHRS